MIKLVLTDLDDTLIPFGAERASERALAAAHTAMEAGLHFGPVTGRIPADMSWMLAGDEACYATGAFVNGQIIRVDGAVVREEPLAADVLVRLQDILDATDGEAFLSLYKPYVAGVVVFATRNENALKQLPVKKDLQERAVVRRVEDFPPTASDPSRGYAKANIHCTCSRERMVELRDMLRREVPEFDFLFPSPSAPIIDITPAGWNKASAVAALVEALGVGMDEVAVFGDSDNDLAMIQAVPNSVAMGNASAEVSRAARWHIGASKDDALADALLDMADAYGRGAMPSFMGE